MRLWLITFLWICCSGPVSALGLLRDPDIERGLRELARPVLSAMGMNPNAVQVVVVNSEKLNAFVIDGSTIFMTAGLIKRLESAEQIQAVIAHEAAHINNGHLSRRFANIRASRNLVGLGIALAAAAAASGEGKAALGIAAGGQSAAHRNVLAHTRSEESSADESAFRALVRAGINPQGMAEVFDIFAGQEALSVSRQDPYAASHPQSRDRSRAVEAFVASLGRTLSSNPNADYWFARARGKLSAFQRAPSWTLRRAKGTTDVDLMRRSVALHRAGKTNAAFASIQALVDARPNDPYYKELQGQILLESRQFSAAAAAYGGAARLAPRDALILAGQGRALLALKSRQADAQALQVLTKARSIDARNANLLRDLGVAYARAGQPAKASLSAAEYNLVRGRPKDAGLHAKRAFDQAPRGSATWRNAQDILNALAK